MKRWTISMAALALLGLVMALMQIPAWTQDAPAKTVSPEQLKKMVDSLGRKYTATKDGDLVLNVAKPGAANVTYRCLLYSFEKGKAVVISCNGLQRGDDFARLKSAASSDERAVDELLEKINQWNINKSLSRAILTKGTDSTGKKIAYARLEADIDWEVGVTGKKIDVLIKQFVASLGEFESFVGSDEFEEQGRRRSPRPSRGAGNRAFPAQPQGENAVGDAIQASWRVKYAVERKNGLAIAGAWFKKKGDADWFKVLEDVRVSTLYVPYEDGNPRYFDMDIGVAPYTRHGPWAHNQLVAAEQNLIGPNGKKINEFVVRENRDAGLLWLFNDKLEMNASKLTEPNTGKTYVHRRQEMVLWSIYQAIELFLHHAIRLPQ